MTTIPVNDTFSVAPALWNSGTSYVSGNLVSYNGINYQCLASNSNTAPPNQTYWNPIQSGGSSAAGSDLTVHVGEVGATWTKHFSNGAAGSVALTAASRIRGNAGGGSGQAQYVSSGTPSNANYTVAANIIWTGTNDQQYVTGLLGRAVAGANTFYVGRINVSNGGAGAWELYKCVAGAYTQIGSAISIGAFTTGRIRIVFGTGNQLFQYSTNGGTTWTTIISGTDADAALTGVGSAGVQFYSQTSAMSDSTGIHLDNFSVTDNAAVTVATNNAGLAYSPKNWNVQSTYAKSVNTGAYNRTFFTGATCALLFNLSLNTVGTIPLIDVKIDGMENWTTYAIAPVVVLTTPPESDSSRSHLVEWRIRLIDRTVNCWDMSVANAGVTFLGYLLDSGASVSLPTSYSKNVIVIIDSTGDAYQTIDWRSYLGCEVGMIGFDGLGFVNNNSPGDGVPLAGTSYLLIYSGVTRDWTGIHCVVFGHGQNDIGSEGLLQSRITATILDIITTRNTTTSVLVTAPFTSSTTGAAAAAALQIAANSFGLSKVKYWDKGANINPASDTVEGVHPFYQAYVGKVMPDFHDQIVTSTNSTASSSGIVANGSGIFANQ